MANFEGLIRGALAAKDATSPEVRNTVYQSSRNALKRLIETNRSLTVEAAVTEQRALEEAIALIENEYTQPKPQPKPAQPEDPLHELREILLEDSDEFRNAQQKQEALRQAAVAEAEPQAPEVPQVAENPIAAEPAEVQSVEPEIAPEAPAADGAVAPEVSQDGVAADPATADPAAVTVDPFPEPENLPLEFAKRRKTQKIFAWTIVSLVVIGLLAWLVYYLIMGITDGTLFSSGDKPLQNPNGLNSESQSAGYITILEPADLSSLVTANRGQAEIVNEISLEMIRLVSVRDDLNRSQPADPILIRLKPGVLEAISGKNVTFEIYAKSGNSKPAQFTVKCQFGDLGSCGRKRFRVGLQPEASIFAFDISSIENSNVSAYIAISTDITEVATITGKGDPIDIVYARLRAN